MNFFKRFQMVVSHECCLDNMEDPMTIEQVLRSADKLEDALESLAQAKVSSIRAKNTKNL
jgi:fumarate hydratase class II